MTEEMCGTPHPFHRIPCIRNPGHKGMHWFTTRWQEGVCIFCREESDNLDHQGICPDCMERLAEQVRS